MTEKNYEVPGISCGHCVWTIEQELSQMHGISSVSASETTREVVVSFEEPADDKAIRALLAEINFPAE